MRKYVGKYILLFALCLAIGVSVCLLIQGMHNSSEGQRQTLMNRAADELSDDNAVDGIVRQLKNIAEHQGNREPNDDGKERTFREIPHGAFIFSFFRLHQCSFIPRQECILSHTYAPVIPG